jgi:hypothetical protein
VEAVPVVVVVAVPLGRRPSPAAIPGVLVPVPPVEVLAVVPPVEAIAIVPHVVEVVTVLVPPAVEVITTTVVRIVPIATTTSSTAVTPPILETAASTSIHDDTIHNCGKRFKLNISLQVLP